MSWRIPWQDRPSAVRGRWCQANALAGCRSRTGDFSRRSPCRYTRADVVSEVTRNMTTKRFAADRTGAVHLVARFVVNGMPGVRCARAAPLLPGAPGRSRVIDLMALEAPYVP